MDNFEPIPNRSGMIWNILSILVVVAIIGLVGFFGSIFFNPYNALNPFPPAPLPTLLTYPTATITPLPLPATNTPTITIQPSATKTQLPTWTPIPSFTPFVIGSATTPLGTQAPVSSGMPFEATLTYVGSTYYHPDAGCNWMGVAGQAVDINNSPVLYLAIHISGTLGGKFIDYYSLTGTAPNYGQAGFEFVLGDKAIASSDTLWIQLVDQQNLPLTDQVKLTTYNDCAKNLIMIRFKKVR
jgi:hypothetical protein